MAWKWFWNTETKYYDGEITRETDWGGDASTDNQPVSGGRVQEWLKTNINGRYGFLNMRFNESESMYYIECFTSEDDYKKYENDKVAYAALLLQSVQIPISTVEGDSFTATLKTSLKNDANIVVSGTEVNSAKLLPLPALTMATSSGMRILCWCNAVIIFPARWSLLQTMPSRWSRSISSRILCNPVMSKCRSIFQILFQKGSRSIKQKKTERGRPF